MSGAKNWRHFFEADVTLNLYKMSTEFVKISGVDTRTYLDQPSATEKRRMELDQFYILV